MLTNRQIIARVLGGIAAAYLVIFAFAAISS